MVGLRMRLRGLKHVKNASASELPSTLDKFDSRRHTTDLTSLSVRQPSYQASPVSQHAVTTEQSEPRFASRGHSYGPATFNGVASVHMGDVYYHCNQDILQHKSESEVSKAFKAALYYSTMDDRKAQLQSIDTASFDWIWTQTTFPRWLQGSEGLFWICGKPASGKSTLAHHLANTRDGSEEVLKYLERDGKKWTLVHFFFDFRAGKGVANTPLGMLRSLLLQLVNRIKPVHDFVLDRCGYRLHGNWSEHESELLALISDATRAADVLVCGFIDGLDEYTGKLGDLASTIFTLQEHSGMKLCLASRPENELAYRLQNLPGFTMQDYNEATIYAYMGAATSSLAQFAAFEDLDPILHQIVSQANGVILWARFAVDELVSGILRGSTLTEISQQLDFYPQDLETVYSRVWESLTPWEKIQAAIALCIVENWSLSHLSATVPLIKSLMIEDLFAIWSMTVEQMDASRSFGPEFSETQFRLRLHTMLGTLVEFVSMSTFHLTHDVVVRLIHKSFQTYLDKSHEYQIIADNLKQYIDVAVLAPKYYAQIIQAASQDLIMNPNIELTEDIRNLHQFEKALEPLKCRKLYPCRVHNPKSLARALLYLLYFKVLDEPEHFTLLRSTTKSWLWQMYGDANHRALLCALPERPHQYLELFCFMSHELVNGFDNAMKEYDAEISDWYRSLLFGYAISLSAHLGRDASSARFFHTTLPHMPWQAHYLALTTIAATEPVFEEILTAVTAQVFDYDTMIHPSHWWQHDAMHILCCWVWSPFHIDDEVTLRKRLDFLLARGISVDDRIYQGGTALHALFEYKADFVNGRTYLRYCRLPDPSMNLVFMKAGFMHFSIAKFRVLLDKNVDLSASGPNSAVVQAARNYVHQYSNYLTRRFSLRARYESLNTMNEDTMHEGLKGYYQTIRAIEHEVIPALEARITEANDDSSKRSTS